MSKFLKKLSAFVTVLAVLQAFLGCSNLIKPEKDKPGRVIINLSSSSRAAADISNLSDIDSFWCGIYSGAKLIAQAEDNNGVIEFEDIPEGTYRFDVKGFKNEAFDEDSEGNPVYTPVLQIFGRTAQKVKAGNDNEVSLPLVMADEEDENLFYVKNSSTLKSMAEASAGSGDFITLVLAGQTTTDYADNKYVTFTLSDNVIVPVNVSLKMKAGTFCASGECILKFEPGRSTSGISVEENDDPDIWQTSLGKTREDGSDVISTGDKLLIDGGFNGKVYNSAPLITISGSNDVYAYENVEIRNCASNGNGAAIYVDAGSKFTLSGAVIHDNRANDGAAVYLATDSEMTMNDGIVTSNFATGNGGGIAVDFDEMNTTGGIFTMSDGAIFGNSAEKGSNFYTDETNKQCTVDIDGTTRNITLVNAPLICSTEKIKVTRADGQKFIAVPLDTDVTEGNLRLTYKGYEVASNAKIQEPYAENSFGKMQVPVQANEEQLNVYIDVYLDPAKLLTMPKKDVWNSGTDKLEIGTGYDDNLYKQVNYYDNGNTGDAFQLFNRTCTYEWYKDSEYLENAGSSYELSFDDKSSKATYKCVQTLTPVTSIVDARAGSDGIDISRWFTSTEPVVLTYIWEPEDAGRGDSQQTGGTESGGTTQTGGTSGTGSGGTTQIGGNGGTESGGTTQTGGSGGTESGGTGTEQNEFNPSLMSVSYTATTIPTAQSSEQVLTDGLSFTYNGKETDVQNAELKIPADTFGSVPCTVTYTYSETEYTASVRVPVHVNLLPAPDADSKVLEEETITIIDKKVGDEFTLTPEVLTEKQACLFYAEDSDTAENLTLEYDVNCYWNDNVAPSPTYNDAILDSEEIDVSCNIIYKAADSLSSYAEYILNSEVTVKKTYKIIPVVVMTAPEVPENSPSPKNVILDDIGGVTLRLCSTAAGKTFNPTVYTDQGSVQFQLYKYDSLTSAWNEIGERTTYKYNSGELSLTIEEGTNYYYIGAYTSEEIYTNSGLLTIICDSKFDDVIGSVYPSSIEEEDVPDGIVIEADDSGKPVKVMCPLESTEVWTSGSCDYVTSSTDGSVNLANLKAAAPGIEFPALECSDNLEQIDGCSKWYTPSRFELLQMLLNAEKINKYSPDNGNMYEFEGLETSQGYWTSTQSEGDDSGSYAWFFSYDASGVNSETGSCSTEKYIRPIAKITN